MTELVAGDIGGTHARFAIAQVADGQVVRLDEPVTLATASCDSLADAWRMVGERMGRPLPRAAALGAASPNGAASGGLTRDIWTLAPDAIDQVLGTEAHLLLNDFGAIAQAVQHAGADQFAHLCGPDEALPDEGVVTVCGPGTGIGCAQLIRHGGGYRIVETEGGHIGFAPADAFEDALVASLRPLYSRVSAERVCAGPGIVELLGQVAAAAGRPRPQLDERGIWQAALRGDDADAVTALDRFCGALGAVAGDLALAQGAGAVVIAGGLGLRLKDHLPASAFARRFVAKGRFESRMAALPVKLITHPQPGLFGAAAAFAARFR